MPIKNVGLEWSREVAEEIGLWGKRRGEVPVYFFEQIGIYTLEKNSTVIYVGQSGTGDNPSIGSRLVQHTKNNKRKKWDTFSWFGIRPVRPATGTLVATPTITMETGSVIKDIETVLIYLLEPRYNLRSGKYRHIVHYNQCTTPQG
jgi:hypothetical protein